MMKTQAKIKIAQFAVLAVVNFAIILAMTYLLSLNNTATRWYDWMFLYPVTTFILYKNVFCPQSNRRFFIYGVPLLAITEFLTLQPIIHSHVRSVVAAICIAAVWGAGEYIWQRWIQSKAKQQ